MTTFEVIEHQMYSKHPSKIAGCVFVGIKEPRLLGRRCEHGQE
jgi:hypothetical protein